MTRQTEPYYPPSTMIYVGLLIISFFVLGVLFGGYQDAKRCHTRLQQQSYEESGSPRWRST